MPAFLKKFKNHLKIAWKNVFAAKWEYACFFVALILVQLLFGVSTLVHCNNGKLEEKEISRQYSYHLLLRGLSEEQMYFLRNVHTTEQEKDWVFDPALTYIEYTTTTGKKRYDAQIRFLGDPVESVQSFHTLYDKTLEDGGAFGYSETPLLEYYQTRAEGTAGFFLLLLLCTGLSFLLMTVLYRIKLKHYKFTYGIYLSFGADFKRLLIMAFSEMLVILAITVLPSILLTYLLGLLIYIPAGGLSGFYFLPILTLLIGSALSSLLSVILPVLVLSKGTPVKMLLAEDNANLVRSPRHSSRILKKHSILALEGLGIFRYRRYFAGLLFSAVLFGVLFVSGAYLADSRRIVQQKPSPRYTLDFSDSPSVAEDMLDELRAVDGVRAVLRDDSAHGSNILLPKKSLAFNAGYKDYPRNSAYEGSVFVKYTSADEYALSLIEDFYGYSYTGDLSLLQSDPENYVVVSDSANNRKVTGIKPGEKLCVAIEDHIVGFLSTEGESFGFKTELEGNDLLPSLYQAADYTFREFTVAAVITGAPSDQNIELFFAPETFLALTGKKTGGAKKAEVYLDPSLSEEEIAETDEIMSTLSYQYSGVKLQTQDASGEKRIAEMENGFGFYTVLSVLLFLVCPLIFFFSQSLFYFKRKLEFDIFRAVGTVMRDVRRMYFFDGTLLALTAGILYSLLSWGAVTLCCYVLNRGWMQTILWGAEGSYRFTAAIPLWAFLPGLVLTVLIAFLASAVPYFLYKRKTDTQISLDFSEESI